MQPLGVPKNDDKNPNSLSVRYFIISVKSPRFLCEIEYFKEIKDFTYLAKRRGDLISVGTPNGVIKIAKRFFEII